MNESQKNKILQHLPSVNDTLSHPVVRELREEQGVAVLKQWVRAELDALRQELLQHPYDNTQTRVLLLETLAERVEARAQQTRGTRLGSVINATGVILHTGLGRAPLSEPAKAALLEAAGACNVEVDLDSGERTYRGFQLLSLWQMLTSAEDLLVVNNNAAATLLCLQGLCKGREVLISRGQLIEIGGSFRLPEIFELSGAILKEVGTTNRTRLKDYEKAITPETAAILHVHPSNYQIIGFTESPSIEELVDLARRTGILCLDDIGSGALIPMSALGLGEEPSFPASLAAGADVVLGSGDKLLGGPQAGLLTGKSEIIEKLRNHPLARALRVDKLTLAALDATLRSYLNAAQPATEHARACAAEIPVLHCLTTSLDELSRRAEEVRHNLAKLQRLGVELSTGESVVGGGSLAGVKLPTICLIVSSPDRSTGELARQFRLGEVRIAPRIQDGRLLLDLRSVLPSEDAKLVQGILLLDEFLASEAS